MGIVQATISVIVVTFNNERQVSRCIDSILDTHDQSLEVIIVDNASTDGTRSEVRKYLSLPNVRLFSNSKNLGFAYGVNMGVRHARGELIVLLNPDAYLGRSSLARFRDAFESSQDNLLIVQPKVVRASDPTKLDSTGDFIDLYGFEMRRGGDPPEEDHGQYDDLKDIFSARAAALVTTRSLFGLLDGFHTGFFVSHEDIDFCWRARMMGGEVLYVPEVSVLHEVSSSISSQLRAFHGTKNRLEMLIRNYEFHNLLRRIVPAIVMALWLCVGEFAVRRKPRLGLIRLAALFSFFLGLPKTWKSRLRVQTMRRLDDAAILPHMAKGNSVFIHLIRTFSHRHHQIT